MKHNHLNNKQPLGSRGFYGKMAPILRGGLDQTFQELETFFSNKHYGPSMCN